MPWILDSCFPPHPMQQIIKAARTICPDFLWAGLMSEMFIKVKPICFSLLYSACGKKEARHRSSQLWDYFYLAVSSASPGRERPIGFVVYIFVDEAN